MGRFAEEVQRLYQRHIVETGDQPHFFVLVSFILTFLLVRFVTHSIRSGRVRIFRNVQAGHTHIHHLVWGILLLLATGYIAIAFEPSRGRESIAVLFGAGAALTMDEFALWLNLRDVYWTEKGRQSIDAVIVTAALLALFAIGPQFWIGVVEEFGRLVGVSG